MRMKEMHPLCCMPIEAFAGGNGDGSPPNVPTHPPIANAGAVAGVLHKWTNYSKGWRSRWFLLHNGVLSYSKSRRSDYLIATGVRTIGDASLSRTSSVNDRRKNRHSAGIVHLKISSFRESRSDDRRFYIFTATKTLHLRTNSKKDRIAWIEALASTRNLFSPRPLDENLSAVPNDLSLSTERLKKKLLEEGVSQSLVSECEQIMLSEFAEIQGQLRVFCEERSTLLDTLRQLEAANFETEPSVTHDNDYQVLKHPFSSSECEKYTVFSTTESSDEIDKQEVEEVSDEEISFFDTHESFHELTISDDSMTVESHMNVLAESAEQLNNKEDSFREPLPLDVERRTKLPDPLEKEKSVSLWSMIKDNVGKDLTRVCLPVYFNEPISSLQKCCEDMEYSYLLDKAYEYGKVGDSLQRILNVAAFAVSGYASSEGRHCKPFNPLLGETYEADFPDKGIRFFSEKVSHHPTIIACHCEGKGWKFWGDSNLRTKFWGRSIQLDPVGVLTLEFDDGEIFQWSKVTTSIYNLILGKLYCDHHGTMHIRGNRQFSSRLRFKEQSILDRNPHQVDGFIEDASGKKVASIYGKWDDCLHYACIDGAGKECRTSNDSSLLWRLNSPPVNVTRYNLTSFAITLNEITPGLQKLPPTDSRFRPDQRHLENGEYEKANLEKQRLERRQRMSRKLQECGWKPRWFQKESENGPYRYVGGYWESREDKRWDGCQDIFGEFNEDAAVS
uniref:PH domain-containing protein n=1 Tax=Kalanchoe fedtschenkoi TaxID=63787 RepID=A0A7N0UAS3_KALFE